MTSSLVPPPPMPAAVRVRPPFLRRDLLWLVGAVLVAVAVRVAWVLYVAVDPNGGPLNDSVFYHNAAHFLADGKGYVEPLVWRGDELHVTANGDATAHWPPGYPAVLAVVYKLFGWHLLPAKLLNVAFGAITVALTYVVARRLFGPKVAVLSSFALAVFPGQVYFSTLLMTETLFAMVFMLEVALVLFWTLDREASWWRVAAIGALAGYGALVRAEGLLLVPLIVALWLFTIRPRRRLLGHVAMLLVGTALVLTPWTVRNAVELDKFVLVRDNAGWAISAGLDPDFKEENLTDIELAFEPPRPPLGDVLSHWATHPWEIPSFAWRKLDILYSNDSEGIYLVQTLRAYLSERGADGWSDLADIYFFTIGAAALVAAPFVLLSRQKGRMAVLWFAAGWSLVFVAFVPATRYHFPVGPLIAIFGAATPVWLWDATLGRLRLPRVRLRRPHEVLPAASGRPSAPPL